MLRLLVPVDGSEVSTRAVEQLVKMAVLLAEKPEVHLLTVQGALPQSATRFVSQQSREAYHREEGEKDLARARKILGDAGFAYVHHISVGEPATVIAQFVGQLKIDLVLMGTRGRGGVAGTLLGSVARSVVQLCDAPVLLVK